MQWSYLGHCRRRVHCHHSGPELSTARHDGLCGDSICSKLAGEVAGKKTNKENLLKIGEDDSICSPSVSKTCCVAGKDVDHQDALRCLLLSSSYGRPIPSGLVHDLDGGNSMLEYQ